MSFGDHNSHISQTLRSRGVLFSSEAAERLLVRHAFSQIEQVFSHPRAVSTRHVGRAVFPVEWRDDDGGMTEVFVKLQWGRRPLIPRIEDLAVGTLFRPLPNLEWCGLQAFRDAGLNVPESLALLQSGAVMSFRSAIVMRAAPVRLSIHDLLRFGKWTTIPADDRAVILAEVAAIAHRIHALGLAWRGISCKHFLPERRNDGGWRLWLLDCEGVQPLRGRKMLARDLRKLYDSFEHIGADTATLLTVQDHLDGSPRFLRRAA